MPEDQKVSRRSVSSQQDHILVTRALEGDQRAYLDLVQKYQKGLHLHIRRTIGSIEGIEDLVHEAFIKAFRALHTYSANYAFSTWLYKIASTMRLTTSASEDWLRLRWISQRQPRMVRFVRKFQIPLTVQIARLRTGSALILSRRPLIHFRPSITV